MKVVEQQSKELPSSPKYLKKPINPFTVYPKPIIIQNEALSQSIALLSKFEYLTANNEDLKEFIHKKCDYCSNIFPTIEGKDYSCKGCHGLLCKKHREMLNHHCVKVSTGYEKYLMAKNVFKNKLKEIKSKGQA